MNMIRIPWWTIAVMELGCAAPVRQSSPQPPRAAFAAAGPPAAPIQSSNCGPQLGEIQGLTHGRVWSNVGSVFQVACPADCDKHGLGIWGTDGYTGDSAVCTAAIHAGVINGQGGVVTVRVQPPLARYDGTKRNGIRSFSWDTTTQGDTSRKSYVFVTPSP